MKLLDGKVALITGATRGIGKGVALKFAEQGAKVAFTYVSSEEKAKAVEDELKAFGVQAKGYKSNAADTKAAEELINAIVNDFGGLDIVVNNAGITRDNLLMRMTEEAWDEVIDTNLKSVFNITKYAQRPMLKAKGGSIINMSSVIGVGGNPGQSNYAASKAGIIGFSKSIAKELGSRNIRCNVICPGFIETEMTAELGQEAMTGWLEDIAMKRPGTTEDVANCALFLASDMSSYISAEVICVDGVLKK